MGPRPRGRTPRERCIPATAMSSRDTLAIGESVCARGWVDGVGPSARLRLDLKLIGLGHRSPQPAAVTATWPDPCSLARSLQPGRGPTAAIAGHCSACGSLQRLWVTAALAEGTACRARRPAWRVRPVPPWCRARLSHAWLPGPSPFYRDLLQRDSSILFLRIQERPMTFF